MRKAEKRVKVNEKKALPESVLAKVVGGVVGIIDPPPQKAESRKRRRRRPV